MRSAPFLSGHLGVPGAPTPRQRQDLCLRPVVDRRQQVDVLEHRGGLVRQFPQAELERDRTEWRRPPRTPGRYRSARRRARARAIPWPVPRAAASRRAVRSGRTHRRSSVRSGRRSRAAAATSTAAGGRNRTSLPVRRHQPSSSSGSTPGSRARPVVVDVLDGRERHRDDGAASGRPGTGRPRARGHRRRRAGRGAPARPDRCAPASSQSIVGPSVARVTARTSASARSTSSTAASASRTSSVPAGCRTSTSIPLTGSRMVSRVLVRLGDGEVVLPTLVLELDVLDGHRVGTGVQVGQRLVLRRPSSGTRCRRGPVGPARSAGRSGSSCAGP